MKRFIATLTLGLLLLTTTTAPAQTRSRRTSPQRGRGRAASAPTARADAEQKNAARQKLIVQLKNLTQFIYLYGRFSKDLELTGARGRDSAESARTRAALVDTLRGIREGLDQLEGQFSTTRGLESQYRRLSGVAEMAAGAEQLAAANQLDPAGRTLLEVANRLTDVLAEM